MNIKSKTLVLSTVGAFALAYAIVGSSAFADTDAVPVQPVPSVTAPTTPSPTPSPTPLLSPIQAPAGLTSPSAGITQDDEDDDFEDLDDVNGDGIDEAEGEDDEISDDDSDDQLTMSITIGDISQSNNTDDDMGEDD